MRLMHNHQPHAGGVGNWKLQFSSFLSLWLLWLVNIISTIEHKNILVWITLFTISSNNICMKCIMHTGVLCLPRRHTKWWCRTTMLRVWKSHATKPSKRVDMNCEEGNEKDTWYSRGGNQCGANTRWRYLLISATNIFENSLFVIVFKRYNHMCMNGKLQRASIK